MKRALPVCLSVLAVSCVSLEVQRLDEVARPPQPAESVAVLTQEPDEPYTVIAVLESSVDGALKGFDDLRSTMIDEAAQLGGDALILGPEAKTTGVIFVPTPLFFDEMKLTGQVITFDPVSAPDGVRENTSAATAAGPPLFSRTRRPVWPSQE